MKLTSLLCPRPELPASAIRRTATVRRLAGTLTALCTAVMPLAASAETIRIGIGTQNTTTNTVTGGVAIKELDLLKKYLPTTGRYADVTYDVEWQNFTSGPPIINGMIAGRLQIGMMGDYPLLMNGATGQRSKGNETVFIATIAYNAHGSGNGVVVHQDSPYFELADLKGTDISVPFGSAAHGMLLQAMQARGWKDDFWNLSNQSPEVGTTNLQEKKIDAHADFVPFSELLAFRGYARKVFDGAQTGIPTFHGVVARKDFAEKYPEVVVAYIRALMAANDWVRADPAQAATKIEEWTRIEKEVAYLYLGPGGIHTLDPTIKPRWLDTIDTAHDVLEKLGRVKTFDRDAWIDETYVQRAFQEAGLDYGAQKAAMENYAITGHDPICGADISDPRNAGEIWLAEEGIVATSSPACTLAGIRQYAAQGKTIEAAYVHDDLLGIKLFADKAFYAVGAASDANTIVPFMLKGDAEAHAAKSGGRVATYEELVAKAPPPSTAGS